MTITKILSLFIFLIAVCFIAKFILIDILKPFVRSIRILKNGTYVKGRIVDFEEDTDADSISVYQPVFEYEIEGETFRGTSSWVRRTKPVIGSEIDVLISKKSITDVQIDVNESMGGRLTGLVIAGVFIFLVLKSLK